jgi:hypothetical protein
MQVGCTGNIHAMHFLDVHAGSLQVIASVALIAVTAGYTILTRSMAKAASEALRPYVYLDLSFKSQAQMIIVVGNSGNKVAGNVKAVLTESNNDNVAERIRDLPIVTGIGHLPPGSTRKYQVIVNGADLLPANAPAVTLDFQITYYDGARKLSDRQHIDLEGYRAALVFEHDPVSKIADRLEAIERKLPDKRITLSGFFKKPCPYCGTQISQDAKKCPNCLEWLSGHNRRASTFRTTARRRHQARQSREHL